MRNKVIIGLLIVACFMILAITPVFGYGFTVDLKPSKTSTTVGDTFTVTISINNLDAGARGINAFVADLDYSEEYFEEVKAEDIKGLNSWTISYNNKKLLCETPYVNVDSAICEITFHVKSTISELGNTDIELKNPSINVNNNPLVGENQKVTMPIKDITAKTYDVDENMIKGVAPSTKIEDFKADLVTSKTVTVYQEDGTTSVPAGSTIATGMIVKLDDGQSFTIVVKGDLNGDGQVSLSDVALMRMHMIKLSSVEGAYLEAADINGNKDKADISDFSIILDVLFGLRTLGSGSGTGTDTIKLPSAGE